MSCLTTFEPLFGMRVLSLKDWKYHSERIRRSPLLAIQGILYYVLGLNIIPFYFYQKEIGGTLGDSDVTLPSDISIRFLHEEDMKTIAAMPGQQISEQMLGQWLADGMWCFGLFEGKQLVTFSWFELHECNFKGYKFTLKANEIYGVYTYTLPSHRGRGLAFLLRNHIHEILASQGRTRIFGATDRFNTPAMRYRRKLKPKIIASGIYVELFRRWGRTFCFKRWAN